MQQARENVDGLELSENYRQRDAVERAALKAWLDGGRRTALSILAEHGHVHAVRTPDEAYAAILGAWKDTAGRLEGDVHDQIEDLAVLAARTSDVEVCNCGARELRKKNGELTGGHTFALAGGERLEFAAGDIVRIKRNDYRSRYGGIDVLNGFRGQVTYAAEGGVTVEWRRPAADGGYAIERAWITAGQIADGALQHGYAMTIAAAQGLTCDYTLVSGVGADANSLYPALSRDRIAAHLWLPADVVESEETRRRLGEARSEQELLERAVAAYADSLERDTDDRMVSDELALAPEARPAAPVPHQVQPGHERAVDGAGQSTVEERAAVRRARIDALREQLHSDGVPQLTDEHKARLEELAAGSASRAEQRPQPEPEFEAWQDRPYGHIGTQRLPSLIAEHTAQASRAEDLAADLARQAEAQREALDAPVTPGQERARAVAEILDRADQLAQTAAAERAAQQQAYNESRHASEVLRQLQEAMNKSRFALRLAGTSRRETMELAAAYEEKERAASREILRAHEAADGAHREAWATIRNPRTVGWFEQQGSRREAPSTVDELQNRLAAMRERLPDIERITNNGTARAATKAERQASEHQKSAIRFTASAAALQEEKALRTRMAAEAPTQHARETQERAAHIKQARQQAAEQAQNVQQARQQEYRYEPPSQGRSGPSRGR